MTRTSKEAWERAWVGHGDTGDTGGIWEGGQNGFRISLQQRERERERCVSITNDPMGARIRLILPRTPHTATTQPMVTKGGWVHSSSHGRKHSFLHSRVDHDPFIGQRMVKRVEVKVCVVREQVPAFSISSFGKYKQ